ncbi:hypothetical protein D3P09_09230 [Paenibacillus pinisoli]|uniref:Uncharacterized protein n=1 Tax=Paenibacillus pinisoli TaxID=1276110 RepID=A0A3A6PF45_9BACL|nr:hypothetical protein [Paenibacillus pinisoli]RJX39587.1 hypothetical protein D3P09_09230 [Paenibacillus pinisoli]
MEIDFIKYLPVAAAVVSASLGYIYGIRSKKNDRLIQFTQENLKEIYSPMYHEMDKILDKTMSAENREKLLDLYFDKYTATDIPVYKLGSLELLDILYDLRDKYKNFKVVRDKEKWEDFWWDFKNNLYHKVKQGYRNSIGLLYRDFKWQQYVQSKPYWKRLYFESMRFLFETAKGSNVLAALLVYFSGSFALIGIDFFPDDFWKFCIMILGMSIVATIALMMPNIEYITLTSNSRNSFTRKVIKKHFPKILEKWDKFLVGKKNYDDVPIMHDKRFF